MCQRDDRNSRKFRCRQFLARMPIVSCVDTVSFLRGYWQFLAWILTVSCEETVGNHAGNFSFLRSYWRNVRRGDDLMVLFSFMAPSASLTLSHYSSHHKRLTVCALCRGEGCEGWNDNFVAGIGENQSYQPCQCQKHHSQDGCRGEKAGRMSGTLARSGMMDIGTREHDNSEIFSFFAVCDAENCGAGQKKEWILCFYPRYFVILHREIELKYGYGL